MMAPPPIMALFRSGLPFFIVYVAISSRNLIPYGPAVYISKKDRPKFAPVDHSNVSLRDGKKLRKIYERIPEGGGDDQRLLKAPETVMFDASGKLYALTEDANLVSLTNFRDEPNNIISAEATLVAHLGGGRPLGGQFTTDDTSLLGGKHNVLYFADSELGLARIRLHNNHPKMELVATRVKLHDGSWSDIVFADDVTIGPKSGCVYFSDATNIPPVMDAGKEWEGLYAAKLDSIRGKKTGRLLRYDPKTDKVDILASGILFANGVAVDKDETFIMISESFEARQLKYHLAGPRRGTVEVMTKNLSLPGYPDGAYCSSHNYCYAPIVCQKLSAVGFLHALPPFLDMYVRTFLLMLPKRFIPSVGAYGGVVELDSNGELIRLIQDPTGEVAHTLTSVVEHDGKLYMGSLVNDYVTVYDLK